MQIVLLSGGSGKRLWPLSNDIRAKQFLKLFPAPDGGFESMVQRVYRLIRSVDPEASVTIATADSQVPAIRNQLGESVGISVEPCRRDTFPAIALAAAWLRDVRGIGADESVVVCPVDSCADVSFFEALHTLALQADRGEANLVLMGIAPTYPSAKYGYILPRVDSDAPDGADAPAVQWVRTFKEKPTEAVAAQYIAEGALWNGGVFAFRLGWLLQKAHELIAFSDYDDLFAHYDAVQKISFDYAVAEREPRIQVLRYRGEWRDLGTWNTLTEAMPEPVVGKAIIGDCCEDVHIINETDLPILAMGLTDVVISASADGILVSDKHQSSYIKPYVDTLDAPARFAETDWGSYRIMDVETGATTIKVTLNPGHSMNYHSHKYRNEVWVVLSGTGRTVVDGMEQIVHAGDVITVDALCRHTVFADTELKLIEVQLGKDIRAADKEIFALEY